MSISLCTPTCDRRPFIKTMIKCIKNQTCLPMEWIILDDGEDKIKDLVEDIPYIKYYTCEKMSIGEKRNLIHKYTRGQILIYIDDDDYYPPERISTVLGGLDGNELCSGSSIMFIYFSELNKIYEFGPYGKNHATAATFGFKRELLNHTAFKNDHRAEEKFFLKKWTIPLKQLDPKKTILVINHSMNTVDRSILLSGPNVKETEYTLEDFVTDVDILHFYKNEMSSALLNYKNNLKDQRQGAS